MISISRCGQEVLERSAAQIDEKQEISTFVWKWDFRQTEGRSMQENGSGSFLSFFRSVSKRHSTIKTVMRRDCRRSVIWQRTSRHLRDNDCQSLGLMCFCCKRIYSAARVRRFRPSDEKRSLFPSLQRRWKWKLRCRTEV